MANNTSQQPRTVHQVMVSSTFTDLVEHRAAAIEAIHKHKLHANVMEHDDAHPRQERRAGDGRGAAAQQRDLLPENVHFFIEIDSQRFFSVWRYVPS